LGVLVEWTGGSVSVLRNFCLSRLSETTMKPGRVFWGVFFVLLGLLLLAARFDIITVVWTDLWRFWPLVLVLIGGALLFRGSKYSGLLFGLGGALLAILLMSLLTFTWIDDGWEGPHDSRDQTFTVPYESGIQHASLNYEGGAGTLEIQGGGQELFNATTHTSFGEYRFSVDSVGEGREIDMTFSGAHHGWRLGRLNHEAIVSLHPEPSWDLDMRLGAARVNLDLSALNVSRLKLENGASRATIRLGDRGKETTVDIQAGASTLRLEVPESAGCELRIEAPLSSKKVQGFTKMGDGEYRTENFSSAERRISIAIHAGVSSIRVSRY
jgi:hypothetical protein